MEKEFILNVCTKTWTRDSHGLYDYESNQVKPHEGNILDSALVVRKKMEIKLVKNIYEMKDEELLFEIKADKDGYILSNQVCSNMHPNEKNINDLQNKMWYVINHDEVIQNGSNQLSPNTNNDYFINRDDIIKLGRVKYAINEIHFCESYAKNLLIAQMDVEPDYSNYDISLLNKNTPPVFNFIYNAQLATETSEDKICKYCYHDSNDVLNPLVNICEICSGGLKYSHYECLKRWMKTKLNIKENEKKTVKSYNIKSYNCEICKTPYPFRFSVGNNIYDLIDIERPADKNYIILESLNQMKDNNNIKSIHVITLDEYSKIIMGRGHDSDVRINDISVSRSHAILTFSNGKINIKDMKSKFGTLSLIKKELPILDKKIQLQIGRTYLETCSKDYKDYEKSLKNLKERNKNAQNHKPTKTYYSNDNSTPTPNNNIN